MDGCGLIEIMDEKGMDERHNFTTKKKHALATYLNTILNNRWNAHKKNYMKIFSL